MKSAVLVLVAASALAAAAAPAQAASPLQRQMAALKRQVTGLKKQVTGLKKQVNTLKKQANTTAKCPASASSLPNVCLLGYEAAYVAYCDAAIAGDAFQTTWQVINQVGDGSLVLPAILPLDDQGLCTRGLGVPRVPTLVPPTIAPFSQMLDRLRGRPSPFARSFAVLGQGWAQGY